MRCKQRCVSVLFLLLFAASQSAWSQYVVRNGNLHVHTVYSNHAQIGQWPPWEGWDHGLAHEPAETVQDARSVGLDVLGLSDHGGTLTQNEWNTEVNVSSTSQSATLPHPVVLAGFEWTGSHHVNVFGASPPSDAGKQSDSIATVTSNSLLGLGQWLVDDSHWSSAYSTPTGRKYPVAQFNHLHTTDTNNPYFNFFAWPAFEGPDAAQKKDRLRDIFCLAELGTYLFGPLNTGYMGVSYTESVWRSALMNGWHVAPAIGNDNSAVLNDNAREKHTGILVDNYEMSKGRREAVMDALRDRRTFAAEDANASIVMKVRPSYDTQWRWMGSSLDIWKDESLVVDLDINDDDINDTDDYLDEIEVLSATGAIVRDFGSLNFSKSHQPFTLDWATLKGMSPTRQGEVCFYGRAVQNDQDHLISAPVWLSLHPRRYSVLTVPNQQGTEGSTVRLTARLAGHGDTGVAGKTLEFFIGSKTVGQAQTDANGNAFFDYLIPLDSCDLTEFIKVHSTDDGDYASQDTTAFLSIQKANLTAIRVSPSGDDSNTGFCWSRAKRTIQAALNAAGQGGEVWLAAGTYTQSATLPTQCRLYGGFAGTETTATQRNPATHPAVINGNNNTYALSCEQGSVVDGVRFSDAAYGVRGNPSLVTNTTFDRCQVGVYTEQGGGTVTSNNFSGCTYGVTNTSQINVDARGNWWGHPTGPKHPTKNPKGQGDAVSDYVIFEPWLSQPINPPAGFTVADVRRALQLAGGLALPATGEFDRLDVEQGGTSGGRIDLRDAARLARIVAGTN